MTLPQERPLSLHGRPPASPCEWGGVCPMWTITGARKKLRSLWNQPLAGRGSKFKAEDSVRFHDPKVPGWWTSHVASHPVPQGATDVQVVKDGWDHEHCYFCKSKIGRAGSPWGYYSKADNDWLCVPCYKNFIARHDLRFLQFES